MNKDIVWKKIPFWPYAISNDGRVMRIAPEKNTFVGRILRPGTDKDGYKWVRLCRDGETHDFKIHVLVCSVFNGKKPKYPSDAQVRHINGNRLENTPNNLKWGTAKSNAEDRIKHGTQKRGEECYQATLSQKEVEKLRHEYFKLLEDRKARGFQRVERGTINKLANIYRLKKYTLNSIISGRGYNG